MMLATLLGDRQQTIEVEILGEQWLTTSSRSEILDRLRVVVLEVDKVLQSNMDGITDEPADIEMQRTLLREQKRRYAVAQVLVSSNLDRFRRLRIVRTPEVSPTGSLPTNRYISNDDDGLLILNGDGLLLECPDFSVVMHEDSIQSDILSCQQLIDAEKTRVDILKLTDEETTSDTKQPHIENGPEEEQWKVPSWDDLATHSWDEKKEYYDDEEDLYDQEQAEHDVDGSCAEENGLEQEANEYLNETFERANVGQEQEQEAEAEKTDNQEKDPAMIILPPSLAPMFFNDQSFYDQL